MAKVTIAEQMQYQNIRAALNSNFTELYDRPVGGDGLWEVQDGKAVLKQPAPVEGVFIPRHDTAENLNTVVLEPGEIATTSDTHELRIGDGSEGGRTLTGILPGPNMTWHSTPAVHPVVGLAGDTFITVGPQPYLAYSSDKMCSWHEVSNYGELPVPGQPMFFKGKITVVAMATGGGLWVESTDKGRTWSTKFDNMYEERVHNEDILLTLSTSENKLFMTSDGDTFSEVTPPSGFTPQSIACENNRFFISDEAHGLSYWSEDCVNWNQIPSAPTHSLTYNTYAYGNGRWVCATESSIFVSQDFNSWAEQSSPTVVAPKGKVFSVDGWFIICDIVDLDTAIIKVSRTGETWRSVYTIFDANTQKNAFILRGDGHNVLCVRSGGTLHLTGFGWL